MGFDKSVIIRTLSVRLLMKILKTVFITFLFLLFCDYAVPTLFRQCGIFVLFFILLVLIYIAEG